MLKVLVGPERNRSFRNSLQQENLGTSVIRKGAKAVLFEFTHTHVYQSPKVFLFILKSIRSGLVFQLPSPQFHSLFFFFLHGQQLKVYEPAGAKLKIATKNLCKTLRTTLAVLLGDMEPRTLENLFCNSKGIGFALYSLYAHLDQPGNTQLGRRFIGLPG